MVLENISAFDNFWLHAIQAVQNANLDILMQIVTFFGDPIPWFLIAAYLYWDEREHDSLFLINIIALSAFVSDSLKAIVQRTRPSENEFLVKKGLLQNVLEKNYNYSFSFPSGHSTLSGAIASYGLHLGGKLIKTMLILMLILVMISRLYLGMHFPSDVIMGAALGIIIGRFNLYIKGKSGSRKIDITKNKIRALIIAGILFIAALMYLGSYSIGFVLLGYYIGLFFTKTLKLELETDHRKTEIITGFIGLGVLVAAIFLLKEFEPIKMLIFFSIGLWITLLNPALNHRVLK
ncbi:MAG: phosphatase PAP2 family protein [archaeon]